MYSILLNGKRIKWDKSTMSYEEIKELTATNMPSVCVSHPRAEGRSQTDFTISKGEDFDVVENIKITAHDTTSA